MKKTIVVSLILFTALVQFCTSTKKTAAVTKKEAVITYTANIAPVMTVSCSPCHFPPKGNKGPLDTYASVKDEIEDILERIQKNPGERGFMPVRHDKLADSTIRLFIKWKETGLAE